MTTKKKTKKIKHNTYLSLQHFAFGVYQEASFDNDWLGMLISWAVIIKCDSCPINSLIETNDNE